MKIITNMVIEGTFTASDKRPFEKPISCLKELGEQKLRSRDPSCAV